MAKIALIDNYDSFTYNLYHYLEALSNEEVLVMRNDKMDWLALDQCSAIVISPGPGLPQNAGDLMDCLNRYFNSKKILGVCLGHQALALHFNAKLENMGKVIHGQSRMLSLQNPLSRLYHGLEGPIHVGRYHSWLVTEESLPSELLISAKDQDGAIMSIEHKDLPLYGIQYHPESVLSPQGKQIIANWLAI